MKHVRLPKGTGGSGRGRWWVRRGAVAVPVAVSMTMLMGFAALAIDVGVIYNTRAELQRTADAAALAAAMELRNYSGDEPLAAARSAAADFAARNQVLNSPVALAATDTVFGRASINLATGKFAFSESADFPNAIQVKVRRTEDSPSGPVGLFFANVFGISHTNIGASATALLVPRDIVLVLDLSGSHTDDSELRHYQTTDVNLYDVWANLPGGRDLTPRTNGLGFQSEVYVTDNGDGTSTVSVDLTSDGSGSTPSLSNLTFSLPAAAQAMGLSTATYSNGQYGASAGYNSSTGVSGLTFAYTGGASGKLGAQGVATHGFTFTIPTGYLSEMTVATKAGTSVDTTVAYELAPGPTFGTMEHYGTYDIPATYSPSADGGLQYLPYNTTWTTSSLQTMLSEQGYSSTEVSALMNKAYDSQSDSAWSPRLAVALGLAKWRSGLNGGLWQQEGLAAPTYSNRDSRVKSDELTWVEPYPYPGGSWAEYFSYMKSSSTYMYDANSAFRYRFGLKTFVNYLLEKRPDKASTPVLSGVPTQPMGAVKDAAVKLVDIVEELDGDDRVSIASYGTVGYGPSDKPNDMSWLTEDFDVLRSRISNLQAGMWTSNTNVAQGIYKGSTTVRNQQHGARQYAAKTMILLTDGIANEPFSSGGNPKTDAETQATNAKNLGVQIYTVSVGSEADETLMEKIATIGRGVHEHAEGDISNYEAELEKIFEKLGGKQPVMLIE